MTHTHVEELRRKLVTGSQFADTWDYFLTNFAESPEFIARGKPGPQPPLMACLLECYRRAKPNVKVASLDLFLPIEVPEFKMIHGTFQVQGLGCGFVYFTELDMGMVCFTNMKTGECIMGRFHADPKAMKSMSTSPAGVQ